jgi:arylsulfatase A
VRRDSFKAFFVVPPADTAGTAAAAPSSPQLYNLDQDPSEKFDITTKHPELVTELRKIADEHQKTVVAVKNQIATRTQGRGSRP